MTHEDHVTARTAGRDHEVPPVPGLAPADLPHLQRCVELAAEAVDAGDFPFGSVLVAADDQVLAEDRTRSSSWLAGQRTI